MDAVLLAVLVGSLAFHYAYCLVPLLRHFRARPFAYVVGAIAYATVGVPPVLDSVAGASLTRGAPYFVWAAVVLSIMAWRPYAFVRATGGPRPPTGLREPTVAVWLKVTNSSADPTRLRLEPWAEESVLEPGVNRMLLLQGPSPAEIEIEAGPSAVTLWGWSGSDLDRRENPVPSTPQRTAPAPESEAAQ